jgi:hypothetical protein
LYCNAKVIQKKHKKRTFSKKNVLLLSDINKDNAANTIH